jgi:hypothetical protein
MNHQKTRKQIALRFLTDLFSRSLKNLLVFQSKRYFQYEQQNDNKDVSTPLSLIGFAFYGMGISYKP